MSALAFLIPAGYALIAAAGLPTERSRHAAIAFFAALGLAVVGYATTGFALQFGGVGLGHSTPGYDGLIWEWSALGTTWGPGWGMAGLAGWLLSGAADTPAARALAIANLPWVVTAALIPIAALRGRGPAWASGLLALLTGAVIYPLAGNWIWGGGWLANLAGNLGLGHGLVDAGGAGLVHVTGAAVALAGLIVFLPRRPRASDEHTGEVAYGLPALYRPLLSLLGPLLLLAGSLAWFTANPLLPSGTLDESRVVLNVLLAAAAGGLLPLAYTWLVAGRPDPLMAARGLGGAVAMSLAIAAFVPAWASLATGVGFGLLTPFAIFLFDRLLRLEEHTATLTVHGLGGGLGLVLTGVLADGSAGAGWNGVGAGEYLGVAGQGVTGLLAASRFSADFPGQLQAQLVGLAALALFAFFAAWAFVAPPATLMHLVAPRRITIAQEPDDGAAPLPLAEPEPVAGPALTDENKAPELGAPQPLVAPRVSNPTREDAPGDEVSATGALAPQG